MKRAAAYPWAQILCAFGITITSGALQSARADTISFSSSGFSFDSSFHLEKSGPIPSGDGWTFSGSASSGSQLLTFPAFNPSLGTLTSQSIELQLSLRVSGTVIFTAAPLPLGVLFYEFDRANGGASASTNIPGLGAGSQINFGFVGLGGNITAFGQPIGAFDFVVLSLGPSEAVSAIAIALTSSFFFEAGNGYPFAADSATADVSLRTQVSLGGRYDFIPAPIPLPTPVFLLGAALGALGLGKWLRNRGRRSAISANQLR
jgi:hypothetical protein